MPVTGLPLPFLSYGGSSMVTMWALCGMLASLERHLPAGRG
jgi:cell division protein FtsW (lipid II flippase)